ncbi:hypothetical protein ISS05_02995 [Candidatus Woesearchaeota archaeon]|nr:hypothetical protein [Candidatus Woesearchaeota archaeon]
MNKAQSALEYLMIIALTLAIIVPTAYLFFSYSRESTEQITYPQISEIGLSIMNNAGSVYYSGEYSKIVMDVSMPERINDVYILYNRELVFEVDSDSGTSDVVFFSDISIISDSCIPAGCDLACEKCDLSDLASAGIKKIKLESVNLGTQVNIAKVG